MIGLSIEKGVQPKMSERTRRQSAGQVTDVSRLHRQFPGSVDQRFTVRAGRARNRMGLCPAQQFLSADL